MSIPLSPSVVLTPDDFNVVGTTINAEVTLFNRPDYCGKPEISGITQITPRISISRLPSGIMPFHVQVSACNTTHDGVGGTVGSGTAYQDLHYEWNFGDPSGTEVFVDQWNNSSGNMNVQYGPEAAYLYQNPGTYSITLTAKGKDLAGNLITASTSDICVGGEHYIHRGFTASGTFTLTFDHSGVARTTAPIAHNATYTEIQDALHTLSGLNFDNCKVGHYGVIQFRGELTGQTYSFTPDFSGMFQVIANTPRIFDEEVSATYSGVTVTDMSSISFRYFDSTYDGSNGTPNGTIERPYTVYNDIKSWMTGATSRGAYLKRGSTFTMDSRMEFPLIPTHSNMRFLAYGSGNRPRIEQTQSSYFHPRMGTGSVNTPDGRMMEDFVFQGIELVAIGDSVDFNAVHPLIVGQDNPGAYPHTRMKNWTFDDMYWHSESVEAFGVQPIYRFISAIGGDPTETSRGGSIISRLHWWGGELDGSNANHLALIVSSQARWFSVTGSYLHGGGPPPTTSNAIQKIHHIYPTIAGNALFKFIRFGSAQKGMCVNTNSHSRYGRCDYFYFDGCDITGTMNGLDFSNNNNTWSGGYTGHHRNVVVQFNKIHTGQLFSQQLGIIGYNLFDITIRYNMFWDCYFAGISFAGTAGYQWAPKPYVYNNLFKDTMHWIQGTTTYPQTWYFKNNTLDTQNNDRPFRFEDGTEAYINQWEADGNIFYTNGSSLSISPVTLTFADWQAAGNDLNGQFTDPLFYSLADDGKFIANPKTKINWPDGFYDLEYSLDNVNWSTYTDNTDLTIADYIDTKTTVYFRAKASSLDGPFTINAYSSSDTLSMSEELEQAILEASEPPINYSYFKLHFDNNLLILKRVE